LPCIGPYDPWHCVVASFFLCPVLEFRIGEMVGLGFFCFLFLCCLVFFEVLSLINLVTPCYKVHFQIHLGFTVLILYLPTWKAMFRYTETVACKLLFFPSMVSSTNVYWD